MAATTKTKSYLDSFLKESSVKHKKTLVYKVSLDLESGELSVSGYSDNNSHHILSGEYLTVFEKGGDLSIQHERSSKETISIKYISKIGDFGNPPLTETPRLAKLMLDNFNIVSVCRIPQEDLQYTVHFIWNPYQHAIVFTDFALENKRVLGDYTYITNTVIKNNVIPESFNFINKIGVEKLRKSISAGDYNVK